MFLVLVWLSPKKVSHQKSHASFQKKKKFWTLFGSALSLVGVGLAHRYAIFLFSGDVEISQEICSSLTCVGQAEVER